MAQLTTAFDAVSTSVVTTAGETSLTWSHTCGGSWRVLLVGTRCPYGVTISSVTYGAVALTQLATANNGASGAHSELWALVNPLIGANNVIVTASGSTKLACTAISMKNADQTGGATTFGTVVTATGSSDAPTVTVTSATTSLCMDTLGFPETPTATVGAGQTERSNIITTGAGTDGREATSTEPGATSVVMSWSLSASAVWSIIACSVAGAVTDPNLSVGQRSIALAVGQRSIRLGGNRP